MHAMRSNGWETSTRRNPETQEGTTASQCDTHSHPDTQDLLTVFEHLGTREVFIGTYGTRTLQGLTAPKGWYSSTSPSLIPVGLLSEIWARGTLTDHISSPTMEDD